MNFTKRKKNLALGILTILLVSAAVGVWHSYFSTTKIAFLNFQAIELGQLSKSNDNRMIELCEVTYDDIPDLKDYDMVLVTGMGVKYTEEQRALMKKIAEKVPVYTRMATNPDNNICSVDSIDADFISQYLENGGRSNYRSLLAYIRKFVDGKKFKAPEPELVHNRNRGLLSHYNPRDLAEDDIEFNSINEYHRFLKSHQLFNSSRPKVMLTGMMGVSTDMTKALEDKGFTVYRVNSVQQFIAGHHADSLQLSAVVNMAHGRMGDYMVDFLKQKNIPLFSPVNVNRLVTEWEDDKQGMSGGFMSQSIVTPEIDGAIRPYAVFGHRTNSEGLQEAYGIPERMTDFVETVSRYVSLQHKENSEKRVAICYFKGPGQNSLTASGMEVVPSLYNMLLRLQREGYDVSGLPDSEKEFEHLIMSQGSVFGTYAEGAQERFIHTQHPALISGKQYKEWSRMAFSEQQNKEALEINGEFPGKYMTTEKGEVAVARLVFGNVMLFPQVMAAAGDDSFKIIHGADVAPPYPYLSSYLYMRYGFKADALIHFGAHGSLEYTPRKQVALGRNDWPDRLIGTLPHFYIYTISNVGEAMIAKRRTYAQIQTYLTAPFKESELRETYRELTNSIDAYNKRPDAGAAQKVRSLTERLNIASELGLSDHKTYSAADIQHVEGFAEELVHEKITGQLYTMGVPYSTDDIRTSVFAMTVDPIAYGLLGVDKCKGKVASDVERHKQLFNSRYREKANVLVTRLMANKGKLTDEELCRMAGITAAELEMTHEVISMQQAPDPIMMMMQMAERMGSAKSTHATKDEHKKKLTVSQIRATHQPKMGNIPQLSKAAFDKMEQSGRFPEKMMTAIRKEQKWYKQSLKKGKKETMPAKKGPRFTREQITLAHAVNAIEQAVKNVNEYRGYLYTSPDIELASMMNALNGGYTLPTPGGDPIVNPNVLPTGRNLYAVNVENTPSEDAWEKAKELCENTLKMYRERHNGAFPRKVSYTLWSSEFVETGGATIAQVLYMLGVEPVRDAFGRVADIRLIPSARLGRPRIDVVVQTSGQLRDIAASRLFLINRAVEMAANAKDDKYENRVKAGVTESERILVAKGVSPKEAREVSYYRVFGGVNGNYGTGIQSMVTAGDKWDKESQIAEVYLNNMGAYYGDEQSWEDVRKDAFEAALSRTDVVVQPRQSNTWGALSLDHVYEFMGGVNLAVRNVTGKDPDAYLADYRNHQHMRMQDVKEAIGIESRSTIFNPAYIKEKMKGGASSAGSFAEIVTNTYGWNVMKPAAIDKHVWDEIYNVYVKDKFNLGTQEFFEHKSPAALEEITAVMMETIRKGMWKATPQQQAEIAKLHVDLVKKHKPSCSGFVCDNAKLKAFISSKVNASDAAAYKEHISEIREAAKTSGDKSMVMKKDSLNNDDNKTKTIVNGVVMALVVVISIALLLFLIRKRRKNQ